ncbi:hypothetical protein C8A05DRAFT_15995 [Staphylotrichum tortipilum]|uniref:Uncharacterized protein n=1 Tax=Staphylotrichum tortipilum TaxID=2831512 RepID=A0AAN6RTF9_9PEZI|nr:hypothetical protein C8A05DRAFT_15995 [Staphylotrichum longicolle]
MFLHAGASLHGHEYSTRPPPSTAALPQQSPAHLRGTPLLRSAFSPATKNRVRQRAASDYIPRAPSPVVRFREPQDDPPPPTPSAVGESISESELSDVTLSLDGAVSARAVARGARRSRRASRKFTTYYLGYPTPRIIGKTKVVQKVFLPRLLLQLQKLSEDGRSVPVLEVFPASRIAGPVVAPRLSKRFPGIFGVKRHLGYDDLVLVRRDDSDSGSEGEESLERRNLLAVYSPLRHSDEAEIVLDDGSVWVAKPLANGSFDFVHTDAEGNVTTARWAHRYPASAPTSPVTDTSSISGAAPQPRYTFSIIDPSTRRHPVLATLTPSTLDVQDTYTSVSPSHARHPPITRVGRALSVASSTSLPYSVPYSPSKLSSSCSTSDDGEHDSAICLPPTPDQEASQRTIHQIDDHTKLVIAVTSIWVALRSGWSRSYNSSSNLNTNHESTTTGTTTTPSLNPAVATCQRARSRRHTWNTRSSISDTPRSSDVAGAVEILHSPVGSFKTTTTKRNSMPAKLSEDHPFQQSTPAAVTPAASRTPTPTSLASAGPDVPRVPRRATSSGAAFMQRHLQASSHPPSSPPQTSSPASRNPPPPSPTSPTPTPPTNPPPPPSPASKPPLTTSSSTAATPRPAGSPPPP